MSSRTKHVGGPPGTSGVKQVTKALQDSDALSVDGRKALKGRRWRLSPSRHKEAEFSQGVITRRTPWDHQLPSLEFPAHQTFAY